MRKLTPEMFSIARTPLTKAESDECWNKKTVFVVEPAPEEKMKLLRSAQKKLNAAERNAIGL